MDLTGCHSMMARRYWVPENVKEKRFANWLRDARDWAFSRSRYWGTPIPIWMSDDGVETVCVGSIEELHRLSGVRLTDLHREHVDQVAKEPPPPFPHSLLHSTIRFYETNSL